MDSNEFQRVTSMTSTSWVDKNSKIVNLNLLLDILQHFVVNLHTHAIVGSLFMADCNQACGIKRHVINQQTRINSLYLYVSACKYILLELLLILTLCWCAFTDAILILHICCYNTPVGLLFSAAQIVFDVVFILLFDTDWYTTCVYVCYVTDFIELTARMSITQPRLLE